MHPQSRLEHEIVSRVRSLASGALEVTSARKRRRLFFEGGVLTGTASNLRAEQDVSLGVTPSDPGGASAAALARLTGALADGDATWTWFNGAQAAEPQVIAVWTTLVRALAQARLEDELRPAIAAHFDRAPRALPASERLGLDPELSAALASLSGTRMAGELVASASVGPTVMMALLWVADATESLEWASPGVAPTDEPGADLADDDILAFINEEVGAPPAAAAETTATPAADTTADRVGRLVTLAAEIEAADHHFAVLGLPYDAPTEQFRQAYMRLARDLHPDRFTGAGAEEQDRANGLFDRIRAAWAVIGDSEARRKYTDTAIHGKKSEEDQAMEEVQRFWNAEGDFRRGLAAFNAGRLKSAHELFRNAHQAFPDELEFKTYFTYSRFAIDGAGATADTARRALDDLLDVIERNSRQERKLDSPHVLMGRIHLAQGDLDQARKCFISALRLNPANADAQLQMRRVDSELNKPAKKGFFATLFGKKG